MIAITGLACRFPGAPDAQALWDMLTAGKPGLTRFSDEELAARGVPRRLRRHPDYVPVGGLLEGQDLFDPTPFGLTDAEAALMDPQQRLFLESAWQALEQAGHGGGRGAGSVGVFAGAAHSAYLASNLADRWSPTGGGADPVGSLQTAMSTHADYLPLQVAYRLGLTGPAIAVNTTCSTSLVAVHTAVQSLLNEECDTALAGGVSLIVPQGHGYLNVTDGIYSSDGVVRPFSARGTGIVYSQGVGIVVLRRLDDALADGDPVWAVVRGSAVNNDGAHKAGFTAPSARGQARVVAEAQAVAGIKPRQVGYVEAHGTATRLGDPVETSALRRVFGQDGPVWCGLGSIKGNIGHANTAAGIASLIKTTLAVHNGVLPASLNAEPINESLQLSGSPFEVLTETTRWQQRPELAGVSSFGIGGTNCHVVLEPAPSRSKPEPDPRPQILTVSAHSRTATEHTAARIAAVSDTVDAADLAHTLQSGRAPLPYRLAAIARDGESGDPLRRASAVTALPVPPRVVFAFPGAGSQYAGMGAQLYAQEPVFTECVDECAELLRPSLDIDIREIFSQPHTARTRRRVRDASLGLPALFAVSLATARLLESWGVQPDAVLGHSLGEYTAAVVAGALSLSEAAELVAVRCTEVARNAGHGAMLAVPLSETEATTLLAAHPEVDLAVVNAPDSCVLSGSQQAIAAVEQALTTELGSGTRVVRLPVDAALHSRLVEPAMPAVRAAAANLRSRPLSVPMVTTVTGEYAGRELATSRHWTRQLRATVRFSEALQNVCGEQPPTVLTQVGPGASLAGLARRNNLSTLHDALSTFTESDANSETTRIRSTVGRLWTHGIDVDFASQHHSGRRRIAVPGYSFQRRRLWIEPSPATKRSVSPSEPIPDNEEPLQLPRWEQSHPLSTAESLHGRWLLVNVGNDEGSSLDALAEVMTDLGAECLTSDRLEDAADATGDITGVVVHSGVSTPDSVTVTTAIARHAVLANNLASWENPPKLLLQVTRGADQVDGRDQLNPVNSALRTLPRVLAAESPGLRWRTVDVPVDDVDPRTVAAEIADLSRERPPHTGAEIAQRGRTRWLRTFTSWQPPHSPGPEPSNEAKIAVIIGGLGDVGLTIAEHLGRGGYRVALTSRTGLDTAHRDDRRGPALRRLTDLGLAVEVHALEASDHSAITALLRKLSQQGRVEIIIHAAGAAATTEATPLRATTSDHISEHVAAKVSGALALRTAIQELTTGQRRCSVVLMSSATTVVGGIGMGAYAAVNGFLDGFATVATTEDTPTHWVSVVWDGFRVGASGTERTVALQDALDAETSTSALDRVLTGCRNGITPPVVAVSATSLSQRMTTRVTSMSTVSDNDPDTSSHTHTQRSIAEMWSDVFGTRVSSVEADFFSLGGHSLLATRMLGMLRNRFTVDLGLSDLLTHPTIASLAERIDLERDSDESLSSETSHAERESAGGDGKLSSRSSVVFADGGLSDNADEPDESEDDTFPLTRVQHAYWIGQEGGYQWGEVPCHFFLEYDCDALDVSAYERAWNTVLARHRMLRAVITPEGRGQVLRDLPYYRVRVLDLTASSEEKRADRLAKLREDISQHPGPPDRWPLVRIQAARLPDGRVRLFLGVHVLVCDAASWWIIDRELRHFYESPATPLPEVDLDFPTYARMPRKREANLEAQHAAEYWRERLTTLPGPPPLPVTNVDSARFVRYSEQIEPYLWIALQKKAAKHRVTPTAVLLTAYAETLSAWSGSTHFAITLTLFDRPDIHPDITRVVGDFTSLVLHEVDHSYSSSFAERVRAAQRLLFTDMDQRAFSALDVLSEQSARTGEHRSIPVVFTSALGLRDVIEAEHDPEWVGQQVDALSQTPQTWLDHQALEQGGRLLLQWDALEPALPSEEVERAFQDYVGRVRLLASEESTWDEKSSMSDGTSSHRDQGNFGVLETSPTARAKTATGNIRAEDVGIPLRPGQGEHTLFFMHPSGGDVVCYAELARLLDPRIGVVALTDPEMAGGIGHADISRMADYFVEVIRKLRPHGPYWLGGWSMGGDLAHAMAGLLHARGERIPLLLMLDTNDPSYITPINRVPHDERELAVLWRYIGALEGFVDADLGAGREESTSELLATLRRLPREQRWSEVDRRLRDKRLLGIRDSAQLRVRVFARHLAALAAYQPTHLDSQDTQTLVIRAARQASRNSAVGMGVDDVPMEFDDLGWGRHLTGPLKVATVEADHYSLLRPPALDDVATTINYTLTQFLG